MRNKRHLNKIFQCTILINSAVNKLLAKENDLSKVAPLCSLKREADQIDHYIKMAQGDDYKTVVLVSLIDEIDSVEKENDYNPYQKLHMIKQAISRYRNDTNLFKQAG